MKRLPIIAFILVMSISMAHAQTFGTSGLFDSGQVSLAPCVLGEDDITQNLDCAIVPVTGVSCTLAGIDSGNQYLRRFILSDDGISQPYTVDAVEFGVEVADSGGGACAGVPLDFNVYSIPTGADFLYSNMTLEDTVSVNATGTAGTIVTAVMTGAAVIDPSTDDLVVEVMTCDSAGNGDFGRFYPGANGAGQTRPTYIASDACGIFDPTDLADIGFPESFDVFVVQGTEASSYEFSGFFEPIDNPPLFNKATPGVAIELPFSLNGDFGLDILGENPLKSRRISCRVRSRPLSEFVPASGYLSYDGDSDIYTVTWNTSNIPDRTHCREFVLTLDDGSTHSARFQFN